MGFWGWGWAGGLAGWLGQTLIKDKPKKVQLVVFLSKTGTYPSLHLGMRQ